MMIKPPDWATDAQPTMEGWINRETGELLVRAPAPANVFTQQQIDEYEAHWISKKQAEAKQAAEEIEELRRAQIEVKMKEAEEAQKVSIIKPKKPKKKSNKIAKTPQNDGVLAQKLLTNSE